MRISLPLTPQKKNLTNLFSLSLEHCCLICNAKFYQVTVWIKALRKCKFKFLYKKNQIITTLKGFESKINYKTGQKSNLEKCLSG